MDNDVDYRLLVDPAAIFWDSCGEKLYLLHPTTIYNYAELTGNSPHQLKAGISWMHAYYIVITSYYNIFPDPGRCMTGHDSAACQDCRGLASLSRKGAGPKGRGRVEPEDFLLELQ